MIHKNETDCKHAYPDYYAASFRCAAIKCLSKHATNICKPPHNTWSAYRLCVVNLQVFFCVVFYGLFHGLCYLPVILSYIGPTPYDSSRVHPLQLSTQSLNPVDCPVAISDCPINNKNSSKIILSKSHDLSLLNQDQLMLPWQPDKSQHTNGGDHVTKNKTVESIGDTHNHHRNFRRSVGGKVQVNTPASTTIMYCASNDCLD